MNLINASCFTAVTYIPMDFPVSVDAAGLQPELLDQACQPLVAFLSAGLWLLQPGVVPTDVNIEQGAQLPYGYCALMFTDKGVS